jgi:LysM repeat protein
VLTPAPSPTPAEPARTYKVKRGDTLSGIAARFGTTVRVLIDLNDIKNPSRIAIGAVLELPPETP